MRAISLLFFCAISAFGMPVLTVGTTAPEFQGAPGAQLTISGSLGNLGGGTVFINSDTVTLTGFEALAIDDSPFLTNAPLTLAAAGTLGDTAGHFAFLTLTIPVNQAPGLYTGVFTVLGGDDETAQDTLGTAQLNVQVQAGQATPEPSTFAMITFGIALLSSVQRLRRAAQDRI